MKAIKNIKQIKTTVLGVIFIVASLYYLFGHEGENTVIVFGLIILGILLIFSPDTILKKGAEILMKVFGMHNHNYGGSDQPEMTHDDSQEKEIKPEDED